MAEIEIKDIEIKIMGKKIKLSVEQAKELRDILQETFPEDRTQYFYSPYYNPPYTYWAWSNTYQSSPTTLTIESNVSG